MSTIPADIWQRPVTGYNLRGATLGEVVGTSRRLLVFLRQLG